jgi:UDP-N-acetylmuramoyl-L-alanyl-D-glutamate--2,6-diaminopimelate ligase
MAPVMPVPLRQVLASVSGVRIRGNAEIPISSISVDSRRIEPGALFVCLQGAHDDGHAHAAQAVDAGAVAILAMTEGAEVPEGAKVPEGADASRPALAVPSDLPIAFVPDTLAALSAASAELYGRPSDDLTVVGVTGTNGKTTTTRFLEAIMAASGTPFGLIGTLGARLTGAFESSLPNTTPFAHELQRLLASFRDAGARGAIMEVSSHALVQHRVDDVDFDVAVLTNVTQDHLDFHKTFEAYRAAKARLFEDVTRGRRKSPGVRVINLDDPEGRRLAMTSGRTLTYAVDNPDAVLRATAIALERDGSTFSVPALRPAPFSVRLPGPFNVANALAAIAAACALDVDVEAIADGIESVTDVPGRMSRVTARDLGVYVDYAHTPDALRNVLTAARALTSGRLICVFGCGGDRDAAKRPLMGAIARELADRVIVTDDNPRSEDPSLIREAIVAGMRDGHGGEFEVIADRAAAIDRAIESARDGDAVIIAGKGHEPYQLIGDLVLPFSDAAVAREVLERRGR